jgi:hypothetical protein
VGVELFWRLLWGSIEGMDGLSFRLWCSDEAFELISNGHFSGIQMLTLVYNILIFLKRFLREQAVHPSTCG